LTRLKLRDDACYAPTSDGICILTNHGQVVMTGSSIFAWVDRLAPYLDGQHTLAELTATLPADRRQMTERVINALRERGVVVEVAEDDVGEDENPASRLTDDERRLYRREIGYLASFGPSGERSFNAYRDRVIVLVGAGRMLTESVAAALVSGSGRLRVAVTGECPTDTIRLAEYERRSGKRDPRQRITRTVADLDDEEQLSDVVDGADIVMYACDHADFDQARTLDRVCARAGVPLASAIPIGDHAWLGPFGPTASRWPGWMSAWSRLLALGGPDDRRFRHAGAAAVAGAVPRGDLWAGAAPTVVANQFIREVARRLGDTAERVGPPRMVHLDLRSLRTESHPFLPHPFSLAASRQDQADLLATVGRQGAGEPLGADEFSQAVAACMQPRLGVLGEVTERDFAQVPLAVSQVQVSDPVLLLDPGVPLPVVTGAGLSIDQARRAAVLRGLAVYGSLMIDPRRLHVRGDARGGTGDPEEDLAALLAGEWSGFVWGHGLADGLPHVVPAAAAFPALRGVRSTYVPPRGAAAGYDWEEAVRNGLVAQCRRLTLDEIAGGQRPFTPIEWKEAATDAHGRRYRSIVNMTGSRLDVYDVTGSPRVPTLAFCLDSVTVVYASGFSFTEALRDGLADVLLWHQAEANGEADYAPALVPALPMRARGPHLAACPTWSTDAAATAARLAQLGWTAAAVPLDHDPGVSGSTMPRLVNVVVTHG
jgi:hypothetical protein